MCDEELIEEARTVAMNADWFRGNGNVLTRLADALEASHWERDAALSVIERIRALVEEWRFGMPEYTSSNYQEGQKDQQRKLVGQLLAALDGAPEPEWEYGWAGEDDASPWRLDQEFESVQEAEAFASSADRAWVRRDGGHIVRRRIAGPWLPVPGREGETR